MLKQALEYLVQLGNTKIHQIGNQYFSTQELNVVYESTPNPIKVHSLSGFVDYLQSKFDGDTKLMVHVCNPTRVVAFTTFNRDYDRNYMIEAEAMIPEFPFGRWHDVEEFIIKLQSGFVPNDDRALVLKVVGNIKEENVHQIGDDGVSQSVVAKVGIATVDKVKVPNPVKLKPYRTFVEVDQPESEFVFRMKNGPMAALFEADGGAWKLEAMKNIRDYLLKELQQEIDNGNIVIIA